MKKLWKIMQKIISFKSFAWLTNLPMKSKCRFKCLTWTIFDKIHIDCEFRYSIFSHCTYSFNSVMFLRLRAQYPWALPIIIKMSINLYANEMCKRGNLLKFDNFSEQLLSCNAKTYHHVTHVYLEAISVLTQSHTKKICDKRQHVLTWETFFLSLE